MSEANHKFTPRFAYLSVVVKNDTLITLISSPSRKLIAPRLVVRIEFRKRILRRAFKRNLFSMKRIFEGGDARQINFMGKKLVGEIDGKSEGSYPERKDR